MTPGILDAINNGILTCTGLFVNMASRAEAASWGKKYPQTCFSVDFNIVSVPTPIC